MANIYDLSDTWNDGGTTFNAIKMNVTDTASASGSLLMDLQVGGASKFKVDKNGSTRIGQGLFPSVSNGPAYRSGDRKLLEAAGNSTAIWNYAKTDYPIIRLIGDMARLPSTGAWAWTPSTAQVDAYDLALFRDAANTLAQRNGTNAQTFNLYNTYTDASNYERGFMKWNSNVLEIGNEAAGTGTQRIGRFAFPYIIFSNSSVGTKHARWDQNYGFEVISPSQFSWAPALDATVAPDTGLARSAAGVVKVTNGSTGTGDLIFGNGSLTPTWNDAGTTFTGLSMDVTDTASDAASLLMDLQVGGTSRFEFAKNATLNLRADTSGASNFAKITMFHGNGNNGTISSGSGGEIYVQSIYMRGAFGVRLASSNSYGWSSSSAAQTADLALFRDAAGVLAQRNSTNAQTFNLYNTYTDASNYERGFMKWNSNVLEIGTEVAGTGTARSVKINSAGKQYSFGSTGMLFDGDAANVYHQVRGTNADLLYGVGSNLGFVGTLSSDALEFRTNNSAKLKIDTVGSVQIVTALTVATLPGTPLVGMMARVTDGDSGLTFGNTVVNSGAGATPYLVWYNGTNWTVIGA